MRQFFKNLFKISDKNPPEELSEVETQDDSNVKFSWEIPIITGSNNVFRDIGCDNPEELLEQAETKYANEYLSEATINNMDLFNEIHLQEIAERKDFVRLKKLFKTPSILELPKITLNHLSKRQLTGILGTTEDALKETKDKLEKADLKFTIKTIKAILKGRVK